MNPGTLTFFCGKMGAGKSTKAGEVASSSNTVLICEDELLSALYPNLINTLEDYIHYSGLLKPQVKKLTQSILLTGANVVLDFPANTVQQRTWLKQISSEIGAKHLLYYINVPDAECLKQIAKRRAEHPERHNTDTPEMFKALKPYFQAPMPSEELNVKLL
jgi:predicted kinase